MPELPEVETVVNGLKSTVLGRRINKVEVSGKKLRVAFPNDFKQSLEGAEILAVQRRAKYIIMELSNQSGKLLLSDRNPVLHDHVRAELDSRQSLIFNDPRRFGLFVTVKDVEQLLYFKDNGPEPFSDQFNAQYLYAATRKSKVPIKSFIMANSTVVGVGNIYASESLWRAKINPLRSANLLTILECERLIEEIRATLLQAIEAGGSTLKDYAKSTGEQGYFQHQFQVYGKGGQACNNCPSLISQVVIAGRATYFCNICQK
jgi:formamidopyrimidine-DNA glycosylase